MYCAKYLFPLLPAIEVPEGSNSETWWVIFENISQDPGWLGARTAKDEMLPLHLAAIVSAVPRTHTRPCLTPSQKRCREALLAAQKATTAEANASAASLIDGAKDVLASYLYEKVRFKKYAYIS